MVDEANVRNTETSIDGQMVLEEAEGWVVYEVVHSLRHFTGILACACFMNSWLANVATYAFKQTWICNQVWNEEDGP